MEQLNSQKVIEKGAEFLVRFLKSQEVSVIFCITGAGNLAIVDAINRDGTINIIYSQHEQAAVMEAQGYARVTGNPGIALVTTGGGIANALTGTLSAHLDSVPVFLISGNESSYHCENWNNLRAYGVQGFDSVSVFTKVTKSATRISSLDEIVLTLESAWKTMIQGRPGPVLIDFPIDLQRKSIETKSLEANYVQQAKPLFKESFLIDELIEEISKAKAPLLYLGAGCRDSETLPILLRLIEKYRIPFALSWSASDLISSDNSLNIGHIGIYGDRAANIILQKSDLLLTIGTRLAIPQIGYDKEDFARNASKWYVDIDAAECAKFADLDWHLLNMAADNFVQELENGLEGLKQKLEWVDWLESIVKIWEALPRMGQIGQLDFTDAIHSCEVVNFLNHNLHENAIVVTDVGAGLLSGHYMFEPKKNQRLITSQGLGEMGFGLPGAIGAYFGDKSRQIICLNTDGAIMFNLQELQLVQHHQIPLKLFIFNNFGYSMIKISQENLFESRFSGSDINTGISFPSFKKVSETFDMEYIQIYSQESMNQNLLNVLNSNKPVLIEVVMSPDQKYLPRLATSKRDDGSLVSPPIEDLDPKISIEDLEKYLGYRAHINSYKARGL